MTLQEILRLLEERTHYAPTGNGTQYSARCPAHGDNSPSLSVGVGADGQILLYCHVNCHLEDILAELDMTAEDLFPTVQAKDVFKPADAGRWKHIATYIYHDADGKVLYQKDRLLKPDGKKTFVYKHPDGAGGLAKGKGTAGHVLYRLPKVIKAQLVYLVEGEKDADTLRKHGLTATTSPLGAQENKWPAHFTDWFKNKDVIIIQDNDDAGKRFAVTEANAIERVAKSVKVIDLTQKWERLPAKGDITDVLESSMDQGETLKVFLELCELTPVYDAQVAAAAPGAFLSLFRTLDQYEEQEASWVVDGWIPEGQITTVASDGGVGKTTLECDIISALSNGTACILDRPGTNRREMKVAFLTTEDSIRKKLKKKLCLAGAKMENIIAPDFAADRHGLLRKLKFGNEEMATFIRHYRPDFCAFDPIQGFLPPHVNMGSRNEMRDCLAPLITFGEDCKTTFLILCHTNKRKGAYGRDRIADSADLWDISRSVIMAGFTEDQGVRYLSNEKNNYTQLQETILFSIDDDGLIQRCGTSWKRDREYIAGAEQSTAKPKRKDCRECILQMLGDAGGAMRTSELEQKTQDYGYAYMTVRRAKEDLKAAGKVEYYSTGSKKDKIWYTQLTTSGAFVEVNEATPWDEPVQTTLSPSEI